ncbi:MAG: CPBP family intramembrane metalloprotease [Lachnospira sp.]|jgi:membrane protease YdiL (CAAX protease family)|nr:CPBP family intramembrane metalloprotease [Lachnospira sp.]
MCKRINRFIPALFVSSIVLTILAGAVIAVTGVNIPLWGSYLISQAIVLLPALVYVAVHKINIIACMPYRKLRISDGLLSLLIGYTLIPLMLFINSVSGLFSTNYVQGSVQELVAYPFWLQLLIIAVLPACVEEFVFRGLIYHSYRKNGILGAAVLSGLVFGLMHLNINQLSYAAVMGIIFALLVEATGSMYSSMLAHFAANSYSVILMQLVSMTSGGSELLEQSAQAAESSMNSVPVIIAQLVMLGLVAAGFLGIAYLLFKKIAVRNGRWEYLKEQLHKGFKPQNGERFITPPLIATVAAALAYMLYIEFI